MIFGENFRKDNSSLRGVENAEAIHDFKMQILYPKKRDFVA